MRDYKEEERITRADEQAGRVLDRHLEDWLKQEGWELQSVYFKNRGDSWLQVTKAVKPGEGLQVCFVAGQTPATCLRRFVQLWFHTDLKWKPERPWKGR